MDHGTAPGANESSLQQRERLAALLGEVGVALTRRGTLQQVLQRCAEALVHNLDAAFARIWSLPAGSNVLELAASAGQYTHLDGPHGRVPVGQFKIGLIAEERKPHLTNSVVDDPRLGNPEWARREGMVSFAGYPLIVEEQIVGVMALFARHELTPSVLQAMENIAFGVALSIKQKSDEEALKAAEAHRQALAEASQQTYRELAEAMPQQVWTAQPDGRLDYVNQRVIDYFQRTSEDLLAAGWLTVLHADDIPQSVERWTNALHTGQTYEVEFRLRGAGGVFRWHLGRAVPMRDASGKIIRWLGTNTDIHDRKQSEQALRAAKHEADAANQAKSQFLASMSHELRTPLNAVIGYSEMLQEEAADRGLGDLIPDLQKIHRAGGYLLNLINNVLDLSKIEAGKMDLFLERFTVRDMLDDVVNTAQPLIEKNHNTLEIYCADDVGSMESDITKLRQCLLNLISNAAKFTTNGTVRLEVVRVPASELVTGAEGEWIRVHVIDTGVGISAEQMAKLFEPFAQGHSGRVTQEGTGLGLAITRRLCQMLGGDVSLRSEIGEGSTFTITLPAVAPRSREELTASEPLAKPISANNTVLMVDDDDGARDLMSRFLRKEGYTPIPARNGAEALRLARELRPRIITLDVIMPGMDGWSVLSALKADPDLADIPVIMVSIIDDRNLGFALGATEFITKPIDRHRLTAILRKYQAPRPSGIVLVVEDDEVNRTLLRRTLQDAGWTVTEAKDGAAALEQVQNNTPGLILLDLLMPRMDGFEFAFAVRKNQAWRGIPIIVITAKDLLPADRARLNGHVEAILLKGAYTREELLREIGDLVANSARPVL